MRSVAHEERDVGEKVQEDDQNLWRARYTSEEGWSPGVVFAGHLSAAAPAPSLK
ncbi:MULTISPECIES: hypothetical protein [unclassified Streptomyces]|uniref:hypothetical protein n=1 Tax=unclassified Streptomyces TaxID=2593676 RepID=UPI002E28DEE2|nr:hypothetical protein [Streptomyces sp. NBC_00273]